MSSAATCLPPIKYFARHQGLRVSLGASQDFRCSPLLQALCLSPPKRAPLWQSFESNRLDLSLQNHDEKRDDDMQEHAEIQHLKLTILALRGQMEAAKAQHEAETQEIRDALEAQISDLNATIRVMRSALLQASHRLQEGDVEATATADMALHQLRINVAAMRMELEQVQSEREEALLAAARTSRDEIADLHDTIRALRQKLEEANDTIS